MPDIAIYNSDEITLVVIKETDIASEEYHELGNSSNTLADFVEHKLLTVVKVVNKKSKTLLSVGSYGESNYFDLPSSGEDTVALMIENDTMEGIMDFCEQIMWYAPEELHWYRINGKLICELWWD
jgi:hypothetical protein